MALTFDATAIFEAELAKRGASFEKESEFLYRVHVGDWTLSANLENVRRDAKRDEDAEPTCLRRRVDQSGPPSRWGRAANVGRWRSPRDARHDPSRPHKASTIFASSFKKLVAPALGWPVLVVLPCRDFVYVIADGSPLLNELGSTVVNEFRNSGYPITTEVLRFSDEGIEAIGRFPT